MFLFIDSLTQRVGISRRTSIIHSSIGLSSFYLKLYESYVENIGYYFVFSKVFCMDFLFSVMYLIVQTFTFCYTSLLYYPLQLFHTNTRLLNPRIFLPIRIFNRMDSILILASSVFETNILLELTLITAVFVFFIFHKKLTGVEETIGKIVYQYSLYCNGRKPGYDTNQHIQSIEEGALFIEYITSIIRAIVLYISISVVSYYSEVYNLQVLKIILDQKTFKTILSCCMDLSSSIFDYYFLIN